MLEDGFVGDWKDGMLSFCSMDWRARGAAAASSPSLAGEDTEDEEEGDLANPSPPEDRDFFFLASMAVVDILDSGASIVRCICSVDWKDHVERGKAARRVKMLVDFIVEWVRSRENKLYE